MTRFLLAGWRMPRGVKRVIPGILRDVVVGVALVLTATLVSAQESEHSQHHPPGGGAAPGTAPAAPGGSPGMTPFGAPPGLRPGGPGTGGMEGMGEMMRPPPLGLYPSLLQLPELSPEARLQVQAQAEQRMTAGTALMREGLDQLAAATAASNFAAMQQANEKVREGLAQFESGVSAQRALAEGVEPRQIALGWFKRSLGIAGLPAADAPSLLGLTPIHLILMVLLVAFSTTVLFLYFFKMRRAADLLSRLTLSGGGAPPPPAAGAPPTPRGPMPPPSPGTAGGDVAPPPAAPPPGGSAEAMPTTPAGRTPPGGGQRWSGTLQVQGIFDESPSTKTFRLAAADGGLLPFSYHPGQFLNLALKIEGKTVRRSYTIASAPSERRWLDLTIKREPQGLVSGYLHDEWSLGDACDVNAPFGNFTFTGAEADSIVLIGGGVGVTPLMSVLRYLRDTGWPGEMFLLYCCRTPAEILFRKELENFRGRNPHFHLVLTVSQPEVNGWSGATGRITRELLSASVPHLTERRIHVCGPVPMMEAIRGILAELQVPTERIYYENFAPPKPTPTATAAPGVAPVLTGAPSLPTLYFVRSQKAAPFPGDQSVLEVAESIGVDIPFSCRVGTCGICMTKLVSGRVTMAVEDGLSAADKAAGFILACQARSTMDVQIEA